MNIYCDPSLIVPSVFTTTQSGLVQDGANYFQRFVAPKFGSNNVAVCDIISYSLSSSKSSIVSITGLTIDSSSSPTEVFVDRLFDGTLADFDFFLHIETTGGLFSAKTVTRQLFWTRPCSSSDIVKVTIVNQTQYYGTVIKTISNPFSTSNSLCELQSCELRDSSCLSLLVDSNIMLDSSLNIRYSLASGYSLDICLYCEYTETVV